MTDVLDDRIMSDGRPAYAWYNEIQMLRAERDRTSEERTYIENLAKVIGLVKWAWEQNHRELSTDIHIRIKDSALLRDVWPDVLARAELIPAADALETWRAQ